MATPEAGGGGAYERAGGVGLGFGNDCVGWEGCSCGCGGVGAGGGLGRFDWEVGFWSWD